MEDEESELSHYEVSPAVGGALELNDCEWTTDEILFLWVIFSSDMEYLIINCRRHLQ